MENRDIIVGQMEGAASALQKNSMGEAAQYIREGVELIKRLEERIDQLEVEAESDVFFLTPGMIVDEPENWPDGAVSAELRWHYFDDSGEERFMSDHAGHEVKRKEGESGES
jgi:arginine/lysine/ornithine decarboxylase